MAASFEFTPVAIGLLVAFVAAVAVAAVLIARLVPFARNAPAQAPPAAAAEPEPVPPAAGPTGEVEPRAEPAEPRAEPAEPRAEAPAEDEPPKEG